VTEQPDRVPHLAMRASDADRERVAKVLHDAMAEGRLTLTELDERLGAVYSSKTLGELVPLTADLPAAGGYGLLGPTPRPAPERRIGGVPGPATSVAFLSGFSREGPWVVPRFHTVFAFMGGGKLDLTQAGFAAPYATIQVVAVMGGVEIVVPADITVRVQGFGLMGGFDHRDSVDGPPGSPVLTVTGVALMGGVHVHRPRRGR